MPIMENIEPALARIDAALRRRGYPSIETLKAAKKGRRLVKHSSSDGQ
jgi:hypothetical protein